MATAQLEEDVDRDFRAETRAWIQTNCPESLKSPMPFDEAPFGGRRVAPPTPDVALWLERAARQGLTAPQFPVEYGGAGYTEQRAAIFYDELRGAGARLPLTGPGLDTLAPGILHFGTEAQRAEFLPPLLRGEIRWAQAFSEPNTGSDLASLQMKAVRDGDVYVLNGQKTWSSLANTADWTFCLVRTDPESAVKQRGITMLLIDMDTPGITTRPIELLNGTSEFCEVFFDDARVPVANRLGPEHDGWTVAKYLLSQERRHFGAKNGLTDAAPIVDLWSTLDHKPSELRSRVIRSQLDQLAADCLMTKFEQLADDDRVADRYANVFKYFIGEHTKRSYELSTALAGWRGLGRAGLAHSSAELAGTRDWLYSLSHTIAGGTSEIQLNIIAKRDLRLPSTPTIGARQ